MRNAALILIIIVFLCLPAYFSLPFGNHLSAVVIPENEKTVVEKIFLNRTLSKLAVSLKGIECDADLLVYRNKSIELIRSKNSSIGGLIQLYNTYSTGYSEAERRLARQLLRKLLTACNPNLGIDNTPPLVDAILTYNFNFFSDLLKFNADPNTVFTTYKSQSNMTPILLIDLMLKNDSVPKEKLVILYNMKQRVHSPPDATP